MERRDFLKMIGLLGVTAALPFNVMQAFGATMPKLAVPGLLHADSNGRIAIAIQEGQSLWQNTPTRSWGYNGPLLGPAISVRKGQKVSMVVQNALPESTALHWHGLEIPGTSDGGPQAIIESGATWAPDLTINQPASTCWFHPHPHAKTGRQVAMGLGGLLLIEDDESAQLAIPRAWGEDDIPVILQDKRLDDKGQIAYEMDAVSAAVGWFGDFLLTNGQLYPEHVAPRGWLRLRLLNGCNARTLRIACSDNRPMYVVASDGGFLAEPVKLNELTIYMGERFEVMVDLSDGTPFDLLTLPVQQMGMTLPPFDQPLPALKITPAQQPGHKHLPDRLITLPPLPNLTDLPVRKLHLSMDPRLDQQGMQELMQRYGEKAMAGMSMEGHAMGAGTTEHGSRQGAMQGNMQGNMQGKGNMASGDMGHGNMQGKGNMESGNMGHGTMQGNMDHGSRQDSTVAHDMGKMPSMQGMGTQGMQGDHGSMSQVEQPFDLWHSNMVNGRAFTMNNASFDVKLGQYERWVISGVGDMMLHPFHIHGTQFRILQENGAKPQAHRTGLKDIVFVEGKESEVLVRFMHPAPASHMFMAHCHLLEHEDTGMMVSFTVTP